MNPLDAISEGSGIFSIEPGLIIWTWIIFFLLFIILKKFAWKPMMTSVHNREKILSEAIENAKQTKIELDSISRRQQQMIAQAQENVKRIIEGGKKSAEIAAQEILNNAKIEAEQSILKARKQIKIEKDQAISEIKDQAIDMIIKTSEKVINESLDEKKQVNLIKKYMEEL